MGGGQLFRGGKNQHKEEKAGATGVITVEVVLRHFHRYCYRSSPLWFFLLDGVLVSWSLPMDERGGYEDLRGLNRRSVIPYVHERTKLYYAQAFFFFLAVNLFFAPVKRCLSDPFIAQGRVVTMRPGARQVAPRWLKPYTTSRVIMARSSK
jgi:hypothetical protein